MKSLELIVALVLIVLGTLLYPCIVFEIVPVFPHARAWPMVFMVIGGCWVYLLFAKSPRTVLRLFREADKAVEKSIG